jgi:hypothetical protein
MAPKKKQTKVADYMGMTLVDGKLVPFNWASVKEKTVVPTADSVVKRKWVSRDKIYNYKPSTIDKYNKIQEQIDLLTAESQSLLETAGQPDLEVTSNE